MHSVNHETSASVGFNYVENEEIGVVYVIIVALTKRWKRAGGGVMW
jgi:hypothetical protein